jgi:hypothetical protein
LTPDEELSARGQALAMAATFGTDATISLLRELEKSLPAERVRYRFMILALKEFRNGDRHQQ